MCYYTKRQSLLGGVFYKFSVTVHKKKVSPLPSCGILPSCRQTRLQVGEAA